MYQPISLLFYLYFHESIHPYTYIYFFHTSVYPSIFPPTHISYLSNYPPIHGNSIHSWCSGSSDQFFMVVDPLSYFSFQPVLHDWGNKGQDMCYPACGMMHIKEPLLLKGKITPCGSSGNPLSLSEWSFTICLMPYNRVLSASLNKTFPSFHPFIHTFYLPIHPIHQSMYQFINPPTYLV